MKNSIHNFRKELVVAIMLIVSLILVLNPYHFWMPSMMHKFVLGITVAVFGVFSSFILREQVVDEREATHRMLAGRVAFLSGSSMLVLGIIYQSLTYMVDPWLVATLVVMILGKVSALIYSAENK